MFKLCRSLWLHRRLLKDFVARDLKARYVGSSMGFFWSVIFPFLNLMVYMFVFRLVLETRFSDKASPQEVTMWMFAGITVWMAFGETLSRTTNTLVENANLIQKVVFPSEILPAFLSLSALFNMLIGIPIVIVGVLYFSGKVAEEHAVALAEHAARTPESILAMMNQVMEGTELTAPLQTLALAGTSFLQEPPPVSEPSLGLGLSLVLLPVLIALQAVFSMGLGYFLSAFNLIMRDTFHLVGVLVTFWMFSTPIFYPPEMVIGARDGQFAWILDVNPMYWLITCFRSVMVFGEWPDWALLARFGVVSLVVFALGTTFFMSQKRRFPDLL